jgi:putative membrane protein
MGYLTPEAKQALTAAAHEVEGVSSAEIVVSMRPASTSLLTASTLAGALSGVLGLAFLLFSPWPFTNEAILLDTVLLGLVGALAARVFAGLRRLCTPSSFAEQAVRQAAQAEFLQRGLMETRERTGVLIFVSQLERRAAVVADRGVLAKVDAQAWQLACAGIEACVRAREDGVALASRIRELAPMLANALPRRADDIDELVDELVSS